MAHLRQRADDGRVERDADPERAERREPRREPRHLAERERERERVRRRSPKKHSVRVCVCDRCELRLSGARGLATSRKRV